LAKNDNDNSHKDIFVFVERNTYYCLCRVILIIVFFSRQEYLIKHFRRRDISTNQFEMGFFVRVTRRGREVIEPENARRGFEQRPHSVSAYPFNSADNDSRLSPTGVVSQRDISFGTGCATRAYLCVSLCQ